MIVTLLLVLRLSSFSQGPVFVDSCEGSYCTLLDDAGEAIDVRRSSLPGCAREGLMVDGSRCYMAASPSGLAPAPLTSDVVL